MGSDLKPPQSLLELNQIHKELADMFYWHQVALLKAEYSSAQSLLKEYEETLANHIKEEEEILVPLYRQRAGHVRGGEAEIFIQEHKKILEWLNRLKLRLGRINPPDVDMKNLISMLDDEAHFKKYMEHHSLREDRIFYPEIDRVVDEKEKGHLLRLLTFSQEDNPPHT